MLKVIKVHKVKYKAECIHVWHNRMGHRDQQAIRLLERQNKASGINIVIVISKLLQRYSKAKRTRAPAASNQRGVSKGGQKKLRSDFQSTRR